jgi:high-affinity K+ transport system ATPase subunit B
MSRKGAADAVKKFVEQNGGRVPSEVDAAVQLVAEQGGTPLVVAKNDQALGVIHLKGQRGPLNGLNVMHLGDPKSAIISAVIFNSLIIPALVPLALKGVRYRAIGATALLRRNLLIYGLGGVILPFIGIRLIDLIVHNLLGA